MILNFITWWRYGEKFTSAKFWNSRPPQLSSDSCRSSLVLGKACNMAAIFRNYFSSIRTRFNVPKSLPDRRNYSGISQVRNNIVVMKHSRQLFGLFGLHVLEKIHPKFTFFQWVDEARRWGIRFDVDWYVVRSPSRFVWLIRVGLIWGLSCGLNSDWLVKAFCASFIVTEINCRAIFSN